VVYVDLLEEDSKNVADDEYKQIEETDKEEIKAIRDVRTIFSATSLNDSPLVPSGSEIESEKSQWLQREDLVSSVIEDEMHRALNMDSYIAKDKPVAHLSLPGHAFSSRRDPSPRINPCLMVRGNSLFIYGGVVEVGDVEVTLDDCWALDLNKRDRWRLVLPGSMDSLVWKGEVEDDATENTGE
jgi:hypothetical protein